MTGTEAIETGGESPHSKRRSAAALPGRIAAWPGWRHAAWAFACIAFLVTAFHVVRGCVNVPYWDDFDAYLQFLVRIEDGGSFLARVQIATEFLNEHRTLTSRAAVWLAHTLGASMNFQVLGWAGAAMFVPAVLLATAAARDKQARAAAVFFAAAMLFHLQHWENLFWGGSSADHVTVVPLSMAAILLVHQRQGWALAGAIVCGILASFALAHGLLVFPIGAVALALERRWRALIVWCAAAALLGCWWMFGFPASPVEPYEDSGYAGVLLVLRFWLGLLGAPLAFGSRELAPWIGGALVVAITALWRAGAFNGHRYRCSLLAFLAISLMAIAVGRTSMDPDGYMVSRYRILSCLLIAIVCWLAFMRMRNAPRFGAPACAILVLLIAGQWLEQTIDHWWRSADFHRRQMAAVLHYEKTGTLAGSPTELYYNVPKADAILERCAARGIFRLKSDEKEQSGRLP